MAISEKEKKEIAKYILSSLIREDSDKIKEITHKIVSDVILENVQHIYRTSPSFKLEDILEKLIRNSVINFSEHYLFSVEDERGIKKGVQLVNKILEEDEMKSLFKKRIEEILESDNYFLKQTMKDKLFESEILIRGINVYEEGE